MTTSAARAVLATLSLAVAGGLVAAPATAAGASGGTTPTVSDPMSADGSDRLLRRPAHGAAAVARLGDDLDKAAALNDVEPDELETMLLDDTTLWVHPTGLLYYVDPVPTGVDAAEPSLQAARAPYPYDQTFSLHSKPGSSRTIYLDFTGENVSGTAWNLERGYLLPARTHPAYDLDGTPSTFNNAERDAIQSIWQRVSEDYAPFDVDVTTADPGLEALRRTTPSDTVFGTRALITPSVAAANHLCDGGCGGLAFMGTYDVAGSDLGVVGSDYMQPAWVFPHLLANNTKAIAEAVSHEVGHNLNLDHDGSPAGGY